MKIVAAAIFDLCLGSFARAQRMPSQQDQPPPVSRDFQAQSRKKGSWELGVLAGGGTGLGKSDGTQFVYAGGRLGRVLSAERLPGLLRGNFEWAVDILPLYAVLPPSGAVYGASFKPVIWQWNFTMGQKIAPYIAAAGGIVFSKSNVPPGETSHVNFTPQLVLGAHILGRERHALFMEGSLGHLSNASLGHQNPGYNITFLFTVGMSWFKGGP